MLRPTAPILVAVLLVPFVPLVGAEDPTTGQCDRVNVPVSLNVGLVCALAGAGTNAACPPTGGVPVDVTCTSLYSWSWLAFSSVDLPGEAQVTIRHNVQTCLDEIGAEPVCVDHRGERTQTCAWDVGGECRGEGRIDESWGPAHLDMGEQFKVLVHLDIVVNATSHAQGIPVGAARYGEFSDSGASVEVIDNGR